MHCAWPGDYSYLVRSRIFWNTEFTLFLYLNSLHMFSKNCLGGYVNNSDQLYFWSRRKREHNAAEIRAKNICCMNTVEEHARKRNIWRKLTIATVHIIHTISCYDRWIQYTTLKNIITYLKFLVHASDWNTCTPGLLTVSCTGLTNEY